jgi:hypothetical protein
MGIPHKAVTAAAAHLPTTTIISFLNGQKNNAYVTTKQSRRENKYERSAN